MAEIDLNDLLAQMPRKTSGELGPLDVVAGRTIKAETSPGGADLVIGTVPVDKKWRIRLIVHIEELDA